MSTKQEKHEKEKAFSSISTKSFLMVVILLLCVMIIAGALSYIIPQGSFERDESGQIIPDTYSQNGVGGIAIWRIITAPVRVFASDNALTIIMISLFLLIMSGVFNLLEKTGGTKVVIGRVIRRLADKRGPVVCVCALIFMFFGSFFGMFEELVTLLPLIIMFMISMGYDTMTGLGVCMLAACFGFSSAITNPFSVGLAAQVAGVSAQTGMWLRIVFFGIIYLTLCIFLMLHLKRIEKEPKLSPSYEVDLGKRELADSYCASRTPKEHNDKLFRVFSIFFVVQTVLLVAIALIRAIADYAIPILAAGFLIGGIISGLLVTEKKSDTFRYMLSGAAAMLPAVVMIALASSVTLIMTESGIIDTIMNAVINTLDGKSKFVCILLIYLLILVLQIFIGSSSAKIMLVMPIVVPICQTIGISPALLILVYCMADGFTDVIFPTNPILLVGLSMANVSYAKWFKWTYKLQLAVLAITVGLLGIATLIGY